MSMKNKTERRKLERTNERGMSFLPRLSTIHKARKLIEVVKIILLYDKYYNIIQLTRYLGFFRKKSPK